MYETDPSKSNKPEKSRPAKESIKIVAKNSEAFRDYEILESLEAGMRLTGTEVKALRDGRSHLKDSHARFEKGEVWLYNMHIAQYAQGNINNHETMRPRKLLLHKSQIQRFFGRMTQKGLTMVPLKVYFKHGLAKCEIALVKTKKIHDRREDIKKNEIRREIDRAMKGRRQR